VKFIANAFSPAQCIGYVACILGVTAFLQKNDRRLKGFNAVQGLAYAAHFLLLGSFPASASSLISAFRSFLALRTRSLWVAALVIAVNVAAGAVLVRGATGWLTVIASCLATLAVFMLQGIRMRLVLLVCTFLWLANNILCGSIGGTIVEFTIAAINISTMIRLLSSFEGKRRREAVLMGAGAQEAARL
jgi:hypothetical protein